MLTEIHRSTGQTSFLAETTTCNIFSVYSAVRCENEGRGSLVVWGDTLRGEIILPVVFDSGDILCFRVGVYELCPERVDDFFLIERGSILLNGVAAPFVALGVLSP